MSRSILLTVAFLFALVLVGCSGGRTPQMIASYPKELVPLNEYPSYSPPAAQIVYDASMVMQVPDPAQAADQAARLAYDYGGYLSSSQGWYEGNRQSVTVILSIPASNFDWVHNKLLELGRLMSEDISGRLTEYTPEGFTAYSQITIKFEPKHGIGLVFPSHRWNPGRTLANALGVFISIFGFIVNVVIWIVVVVGPFVAIGWGIARLIKRYKMR
jgi:hypothetical protein